jgi:phosphoglycerol transferase
LHTDDVARRPLTGAALQAVLVGAFALIAAFAVMRLWSVDLHVPMGSAGDGLLHLTMIKATDEQGWPLVTVKRLGAPGELDWRDFPALDPLQLLIVWILSWFTDSAGLLINLLYLLTFPLSAIGAYFVSRALGRSRSASFAVAILYAMLPYHFRRGTGHLFLSAYYLAPPAVLAAYWLARDAGTFRKRARLIGAVVLCVLLGASTVYYGFFAAIFFVVGGIAGSIASRSWRPAATALGFVGIVLLMLVVQHAPTLIKDAREGSLNVGRRAPAEPELYGLKVAQLVLPITEHRWGRLANIKRRYNAAPLVNENDTASLGTFGTVGFVLLVAWLFFGRYLGTSVPRYLGNSDTTEVPRYRGTEVLDHFAVFNGAGVLAGTIGGLASLFSLLVSPQVRSVNRISVYIAFFSLVAAGWLFDRITARWKRPFAAAAAFIIAVAGTLDQTNADMRHAPSNDAKDVGQYVDRIERSLPKGAAVFQLPYFPFPEQGGVHHLGDYEPFRVYAYSDALRWSYGAVRGSRGDLWQRWAASQEPAQMARTLALAGFDGVMIERHGYEDLGARIEQELARASGAVPFVSPDHRRSFIRLVELRQRLAREYGPRYAAAEELAKNPLLVGFRGGFYGEERVASEVWNWCQREGTLAVYNDLNVPRLVKLRMSVAAADPKPSMLRIESTFWNERLRLGEGSVRIERTLTIPPGMHLVSMRSNGRVSIANGDPRKFVFRVFDFAMEEAGRMPSGIRKAS